MITRRPHRDLMLQVSRTFFVTFMVTWFITRLYYFPAYVLNSTLFECLKVRPYLLHVQLLHGTSPTAFPKIAFEGVKTGTRWACTTCHTVESLSGETALCTLVGTA